MEELLNEKFSSEHVKTSPYSFACWFPELVQINNEPGFIELEFRLSSSGELEELEEDEMMTIKSVMNATSVDQEYKSGGCDKCGWGSRTVVRVYGGSIPV